MALHSLYCADVPLRNCSLTHSLSEQINAVMLHRPTALYSGMRRTMQLVVKCARCMHAVWRR